MRRLTFLAVAAACLAFASTARAGVTPDELLADLAANHTHGWASIADGIDYVGLEATIAAGERIYTPCGVIAILAKRRLDRHGIPNRLVGTFSNVMADLQDVPADILESHAMIEVWTADRWVLYDVDGNVKAVDELGSGIGVEAFARGPRRYERLTDPAGDPDNDLAVSPYPLYESWLFANHEAWYDRVLGTIAVLPAGARAYYFTDPTLKDRLDPTPGYEWVDERRWAEIIDAPPPIPAPPVKPVPPRPAPAPPPAAAPPPVERVAIGKPARRSCRAERRRYRRTRSSRAVRRYKQCVRLKRRQQRRA